MKIKTIPALLKLAMLITLGAMVQSPLADTITVNARNSGYYNLAGFSSGAVGNIAQFGTSYRSWLGFDLSGIDGTITAATLQVASDSRNSSGQTIKWWDVTTPYSQLGSVSGSAGIAIFNDLGAGVSFGQGTHTAGSLNSFALNSSALVSLNAADSFWAIGGVNSQANFAFGYQNGVGNNQTIRLVLDVQRTGVPDGGSTLIVVGASMLGMLGARRFLR
jgi:hypothetical protein